jgi:hypothetical protein
MSAPWCDTAGSRKLPFYQLNAKYQIVGATLKYSPGAVRPHTAPCGEPLLLSAPYGPCQKVLDMLQAFRVFVSVHLSCG